MNAPIVPVAMSTFPLIEELLAHLGAAKMQITASDDQIIRDHSSSAQHTAWPPAGPQPSCQEWIAERRRRATLPWWRRALELG
jgi:hypothetical protein